MKFIVKIVLIIVLSFLGQMVLPFWIVAIAGILASLVIKSNGFTSFLAGFLGVFILWFLSAYFIDQGAQSILSDKMITIIPVGSVMLLITVSAVIGGLVGGFGALTGSILQSLVSPEKSSTY